MDQIDKLGLDASSYIIGMRQAIVADELRAKAAVKNIALNAQLSMSYDRVTASIKRSQLLQGAPPKMVFDPSRGFVRQPSLATFESGQRMMHYFGKTAQETMHKTAVATARAEVQARKLAFTWRMGMRIFESFLIYRGIYALIDVFREATTSATEFQIKISQIRTISQGNQLAFESWADALRKVSDSFGLPIIDTAAAAYEAVSNQIGEGAEAISFITEAQKLAITTSSTLTDTVDALSGIINAYGLTAKDTEELSAKLFRTVDLGNIKMTDLGKIIGDVSSVGALLGVSLDELLASIAEITIRSITPARSLTQLRNIMNQMLKTSPEMSEAFDKIGASSATAGIKTFGFLNFLKKIADTKGDLEGLSELFRNIRGYAGAAILTSEAGFARVQQTTEAVKNSIAGYADVQKIALESSGKQLQIEVNKIKNFFTRDVGFEILKWLATISKEFGGMDIIVKAFASTLKLLIIPALVLLSTQLLKLAPIITAHPLLTLATGIIGAAAAFKMYMEIEELNAKALITLHLDTWDKIQNARHIAYRNMIKDAGLALTAETKVINRQVATVLAQIRGIQKGVLDNTDKIGEIIKDIMQKAEEAVRESLAATNKALTETTNKINEIKNALQSLKEETRKREIAIALEDATPVDQIKILQAEIRKLTKEGVSAKSFEDMKFAFQQAKEYADQIKEITSTTEKERKKIEKEIAVATKKYTQDDIRLRKDAIRGDRSEIKKNRKLLKEEYLKVINELQAKLKEIETLPISTEDVNRAIKNISRIQEETYKKLGRGMVGSQKDQVNKVEEYKRQEAEITDIQRQQNNLKFEDILKNETAKTMQKEFDTRNALTTKQIQVLTKIRGYDTVQQAIAADKEIAAIAQRQAEEEFTIDAEISARKVIGAQKEAQIKEQGIKDAYKTLSDVATKYRENLTKLERAREKGEALFKMRAELAGYAPRYIERFMAGKYPPTEEGYETLAKLRKEAYQEAGIISPEMLTKDITEYRAKVIEASIAVEDFLATLPPVLKETLTAVVKPVANTLETAINNATGAYEAFKNSLNELTGAISGAAGLIRNSLSLSSKSAPITEAFGGFISKGKDTILSLLSPGEFVMNAKATRKFYSQLVAMNSAIPAFANGGPVNNFSGDFNISLQSSGNESVDVQRIGRLLQREIRRGTVRL